jgi:hypothetical protein
MGEAHIENRSADEEDAMRRTWMESRNVQRKPRWIEVLPLDPRDLDVVRQGAGEQKEDLVVVGSWSECRGLIHFGAAPHVPKLERARWEWD